jgi:multiple sugar transport system ATP-binding protein
MPEIVLRHVSKRWGSFYAVDDLNLTIENKDFLTILGPSGCGKTTILRMISGLETPTSGKITIDGETVFDSESGVNVSPARRNIGFLFQNYALWPHMSVYENISFGLENLKGDFPEKATEYAKDKWLEETFSDPETLLKAISLPKSQKNINAERNAIVRLTSVLRTNSYNAKDILAFHLDDLGPKEFEDFCSEKKNEYAAKAEEELTKVEEKGFEIDEKGNLTKDGKEILKRGHMSKEEIDDRVYEVARLVHISEFLDRYPNELSGGQQQRVAIARTLAPGPNILFMDEPLSNLDAKLRLEMRSELKRLHLETGATFVYVTHDHQEAMTLSTKICLLNNGVLQQIDTPLDVYKRPANLFVADFVGSPSINFIEAKGKQGKDSIRLSLFDDEVQADFEPNIYVNLDAFRQNREEKDREAECLKAEKAKDRHYVEKENIDKPFEYEIQTIAEDLLAKDDKELSDNDLILGVRPEFVTLNEKGQFVGEVYSALPTGSETIVKLRLGRFLLSAKVYGGVDYKAGSEARFDFSGRGLLLYDRKSQHLISQGALTVANDK